MKINYFFKRNGFISSLKSKIAHDHYQIRASLLHGKKIKFPRIFDFILNGKYCTIKNQSFFTPFSLQILSINSQHCVQAWTRNPSQRTNPYSCKNFQEKLKFEF